MHPRYKSMGFKDEHADEVAGFKHFARQLGWPHERIEAFLELNRVAQNRTSDEEAFAAFDRFYISKRIPAAERAAIEQWLSGEGRPAAPAPTRAEATKRLAEIREARREDPEKYDRDKAVQDEEHDLIEHLQTAPAAASSPAPVSAGDPSSVGEGSPAASTSTSQQGE